MSSAALEHASREHRRPGLTLYLYMAREALRPTVFGLLGLTVVVLTTHMLGYSDLVINRGVGTGDVGRMLFYEAVPVAARMFPFAVLIGCLVALGRMGAEREILVLEASGVAPARLVWPVVSFAAAMTAVALLLSAYATPWASRRFDAALETISRAKPWAQLRAGSVNKFGGWQLEAREVSASGEELKGVLLWVPEIGETIFARAGTLAGSEDGSIEITLHDGSVVLSPEDGLRQLRFDTATTILPESDTGLERGEGDRIPGLPLDELAARARAYVPGEDGRLPVAALELHRRFAYPAATLVFGFMAVPLFLARGNYSRSSGGVMGLVCTIAYYGLMQLAEGLAQGGALGVVLAAWLPNLVLGLLFAVLFFRTLRERVVGHVFDRPQRRDRRWIPWPKSDPRRRGPRRHALLRYIAGRFLELLLLSFSVLFVAYLLIDVMDRLAWFTRHGATTVEVIRFYGARAPLLASRAVPMAILVATSLVVSLLAVEGELVGIRSCGIPVPRALSPVLVIAVLIAPLYFLLNNIVVPRTNALADVLKRTEIKETVYRQKTERRKAGFWYRSGNQLLEAARFDPDRGWARDITIFDLGEDGMPKSRVDAPRGRHIGQGWWRLTDPTRIEVVGGRLERVPAPRHAQLGAAAEAEVDTMHLSVNQIAEEARSVEADGFDATPFWVDFHVRLAEPFACIVLPALVLFFAVSGPPFPGPAQTLLVSGIVGVTYILLVAIFASLGRGGMVPPAIGAWSPIFLLSLLAGFLGFRLWRRL
jgi:LPS export ABC transporter permease LptG/LPS export ABC transporter permease LptF